MIDTYSLLDLDTWPRKQHFQFFKGFDQPNFSICCQLNAEHLYKQCKERNISFYDAYIYLTMQSVNQNDNFRYRIVDGQVRDYQHISLSVVELCDDQTFRFCEQFYTDDFSNFQSQASRARIKAKSEPLFSDDFYANENRVNTVYMSVIPWISFTSFSHASTGSNSEGIPRLAFGKMRDDNYSLPLSIDVHHSLVDGVHVGQFVENLQSLFDKTIKA